MSAPVLADHYDFSHHLNHSAQAGTDNGTSTFTRIGQTVLGGGKQLDHVVLPISKTPGLVGMGYVKFYNLTTNLATGVPFGAAIVSIPIDLSTLPTTPTTGSSIPINGPILGLNVWYGMTVEFDGDGNSAHFVGWWRDDVSPSHPGQTFYYHNGGWTAVPGQDLCFQVWERDVTAVHTYEGTRTDGIGIVAVTIVDAALTVLHSRTVAGIFQNPAGSYIYCVPACEEESTQLVGYIYDEGTPESYTQPDWYGPAASISAALSNVASKDDVATILGAIPDKNLALLVAQLEKNKTVDHGDHFTVMADDGVTVLGTFTWDEATGTRGAFTHA